MRWLKHALTIRKLILNGANALVHTVTPYFSSPPASSSATPKSTHKPLRLPSQRASKTGNGCKSVSRNWAFTASTRAA